MSSFGDLNYSSSPVLDTSSNWTCRNRWRGESWQCLVQGAIRTDARSEKRTLTHHGGGGGGSAIPPRSFGVRPASPCSAQIVRVAAGRSVMGDRLAHVPLGS